jgi:hypothetical protein
MTAAGAVGPHANNFIVDTKKAAAGRDRLDEVLDAIS